MPEVKLTTAPPVVTSRDTVEALLTRSKREAVPIRRTFVQQGGLKAPTGGPLAKFVKAHDVRGLDLYLLGLAVASADPFTVTEHAAVWARALGIGPSASANSAVSKAWRRVADRGLVERTRSGRLLCIKFLKEDGLGAAYTHPGVGRELYFKLPFAYWSDDWHVRLSLPGKAMLLIALEQPDGFALPIERARGWYGISADTAQQGLAELRDKGAVEMDVAWRKQPLSPLGYVEERLYTLRAPFGPHERLSKAARLREAERRPLLIAQLSKKKAAKKTTRKRTKKRITTQKAS